MPYIKREAKDRIGPLHPNDAPRDPGELNYMINLLAIGFLQGGNVNYERLNATYGAMQLAAAEFKRRLIDPYEEKKIAENGDIFPDELQDAISVFSINQLRKRLQELNPKGDA